MEAFIPIGPIEEPNVEVDVPQLRIVVLEQDGTYGKFALQPLERGFGVTLGTPLRRVLLSSIPGTAVTWVQIDGVQHEYADIPHVKEDVLTFLQRVKGIRIRPLSDRPGRMRLDVVGPGEVYAGDISVPADLEIMNPELHLATLGSSNAKLVVELNVDHGKGYIPAQTGVGLPIGSLPVDAIFGPVRRVNQVVERTRVGQVTDYERLVVEIWTDGAITPTEAMKSAAKTLMDQFFLITTVGEEVVLDSAEDQGPLSVQSEEYNIVVERLDLSTRTLNCLKRSNLHRVGEVLGQTQEDLLKIRNFGERSLNELLGRLEEKGLPLLRSSKSDSYEDGEHDRPTLAEELGIPSEG